MDENTVKKLKELVEEYENYRYDVLRDYSQIADSAIEEIIEIIKNL